ncbi:peptidase S11, partial [Streptococcus danieliae]|nr:peptidase S11 [Streptococcus danieliae]
MMKKLGVLLLAAALTMAPVVASADELMDLTREMYPEVLEINRPKSSI